MQVEVAVEVKKNITGHIKCSRLLKYAYFFGIFSISLNTVSQVFAAEDIPKNLRAFLFREQVLNERKNNESAFKPIDISSSLPSEYDPAHEAVFEIRFIEIPESEAKTITNAKLSKNADKIIRFKKGGKNYFRYFVHPLVESHYDKIAETYGGFKSAGFLAAPTSSPRSLIVWEQANPDVATGVKVSLNIEIGGTVRRIDWDELERSNSINRLFESIASNAAEDREFSFLPEPLQIAAPDRFYGNIIRDYPEEILSNKIKTLPGFALGADNPDGSPAALVKMIQNSSLDPLSFVREKIYRPLIQSYLYLVFQEGLLSEPHQQNVLLEMNSRGNPNGKIWFRDLDGFRPDPELRAINGKPLTPFLDSKRPFKYFKFSVSRDFYNLSYGAHLRDSWAYLVQKTLSRHRKLLGLPKSFFDSEEIWKEMDRVFLEEMVAISNSEIVFGPLSLFYSRNQARLDELFPGINWNRPNLTSGEVATLVREFEIHDITAMNVKTYELPVLDIQQIAERFKSARVEAGPQIKSQPAQELLKGEYARLQFNYRASSRSTLPESTKYTLYDGAIVARSSKDGFKGIALLEPEIASRTFYSDVQYPRKAPTSDTGRLWKKIIESRQTPNKAYRSCSRALHKLLSH